MRNKIRHGVMLFGLIKAKTAKSIMNTSQVQQMSNGIGSIHLGLNLIRIVVLQQN